ncbi:MAG: Rho termination factor N-terminal domain-containing protein, partial [Aristaeellaceae bacterium]
MDYRSLHMKTVADLKQIAKEMELKIPARTSKAVLVEMILERQAARATEQEKPVPAQPEAAKETAQEAPAEVRPKRGRPKAAQGEKARSEKPARGRKSANAAGESPEAAEGEKPARGRKRAAVQEDAPKPDEAAQKEAQKPESTVQVERAEAPAASAPASAAAEAAESQPKQERVEAAQAAPTAVEAVPQASAKDAENVRASYTRPMSTQQRMGARAQTGPGNYRPNQRPMGPANRPGNRYEGANPRPQRSYDAPQNGYRRQNAFSEESRPRYRKPMAGPDAVNPAARYPQGADAVNPAARHPQGAENGQIAPAQPPVRQQDAAQELNPPVRPAAPATVQAPAANELNPAVPELLSSGECGDGAGILEIHPEGYGFLRVDNYLPGNRDVYVSAAQIRRFNLRTGDYVVGKTRAQQLGDRSVGLIYISEVNGQTPDMARHRRPFDSLVPVYPDERLRLERPESKDISLRLIDMIAPIGKGQRGMIVSQPKAGKTTLLKKVANAIVANNPEVHLIVLLIDERPEEVTD